MNIRRGTFRLWLVLSAMFIIALAVIEFPSVRDEFRKVQSEKELSDKWGWAELVPADCKIARGKLDTDYTRDKDDLCWYEMPKFRALYPEYKGLKDDDLSRRLYAKAGQPLTEPHPWIKLAKVAAAAFGVPLGILILGASLFWAFAGFRSKQAL
jgi:hypothetical protein